MTTISSTSSALVTADEFTANYAGIHAELVRGVVKEYSVPGFKHGTICQKIARLIGNHVEEHDLGYVATNDTWIQTSSKPDSVRGADVLFVSYERFPKGTIPDGIIPVAPELVFEVRSPSDRWTEVFAKVIEYLEAEVRVVVVLDPPTATATVYRIDELQQIFHNSDPLTFPDVLPKFSVPVEKLFV